MAPRADRHAGQTASRGPSRALAGGRCGLARGAWLVLLLAAGPLSAQLTGPDELPARAVAAALAATAHLVGQVAWEGGYPSRVDADGAAWAGPRRLDTGGIAIAAPGTPALGLAWCDLYQISDEPRFLAAALAAGRAVHACQLASGGWPAACQPGDDTTWFRREAQRVGAAQSDRQNSSLLANGATPAALRLLVRLVELTGDVALRRSAEHGLRQILSAQLANGGWPAAWPAEADQAGPQPASVEATGDLLALLADLPGADGPGRPEAIRAAAEFLLAARLAEPEGGWPEGTSLGLAPWPEAALDLPATRAACAGLLAAARLERDPRYLAAALAGAELLAADPAQADLVDAVRRAGRAWDQGWTRDERVRRTARLAPEVARLLARQDDQGRWLGPAGELDLGRTIAALSLLTDYLRTYEPLPDWLSDDRDPRPPQHRR